jgi:prolyl-tRNA synthetase
MRCSQFLITTHKETPADAEIVSHRLMLRAGLVRKLSAGPLHLDAHGTASAAQGRDASCARKWTPPAPRSWQCPWCSPASCGRSPGAGRSTVPELLRIKDRHDRDFCLGPTHEEVITDIVRNEISSYKQLPLNLYQIQNKVRDEIRPRFGIMRAREFLMKDAYSFHPIQASLEQTYWVMHAAYSRIFSAWASTSGP